MQEQKERVALTSIAASGALTVAKAVVGLFSGSLALLSEAAHSALDFLATIMPWYAGRASGKPADPWADSIAALVVAVVILIAGWRLGRRTIDALTDTAPEGASALIAQIAERAAGVVSVDRVRVRSVGPTLFADLQLGVNRTLPLDRVAAIKSEIAQAISAELPAAEVNVVTEPRALDDETVLERVMVIARNRALA